MWCCFWNDKRYLAFVVLRIITNITEIDFFFGDEVILSQHYGNITNSIHTLCLFDERWLIPLFVTKTCSFTAFFILFAMILLQNFFELFATSSLVATSSFVFSQLLFTCSKATVETLEKGVTFSALSPVFLLLSLNK